MKQLTAPAKVNLALDLLGRREDGYHDLRSVMQTVSLCDTVSLEETPSGFALHTDAAFLPAGGKTLEEKAAEAFFAAVGGNMPGLSVTLEKVTPAYAGLGGGSADVAALLHLLRANYAPELPLEALERIGLTIGSDMPFCIRRGTALAEGRGEALTELPALPDCWIVLCKPDFSVPTQQQFARADAVSLRCRPDIDGMIAALQQGDLVGVAARLGNVFEEVLPSEQAREVEEIKARLLSLGALNAAMSGSGPTVFALFSQEAAARRARSEMAAAVPRSFLAKPVKKFEII